MRSFGNIMWLGAKELRSFVKDYVMLGLVVWGFSVAIIAAGDGSPQELRNATVAILDEDHSQLSQEIVDAFLPPYFQPARKISATEIDQTLNRARDTFVVDLPPNFEREVATGRSPTVQINIDATATVQASIGENYIEQILENTVKRHTARAALTAQDPIRLVAHVAFNPNMVGAWSDSITGIVNNITMLAIILTGAAVVREREHGTMDHLLVMPLRPFEIALAKIWANALVVAIAAGLSLTFVVRIFMGVPIVGSIWLFLIGTVLYLFFGTAVGIFLGTVVRSMPQLGLLFVLIAVPLSALSGSSLPISDIPQPLRAIMQSSPSTHLVRSAQSILFRGAGLDVVWPDFLVSAGVGSLFLLLALWRFRYVSASAIR